MWKLKQTHSINICLDIQRQELFPMLNYRSRWQERTPVSTLTMKDPLLYGALKKFQENNALIPRLQDESQALKPREQRAFLSLQGRLEELGRDQNRFYQSAPSSMATSQESGNMNLFREEEGKRTIQESKGNEEERSEGDENRNIKEEEGRDEKYDSITMVDPTPNLFRMYLNSFLFYGKDAQTAFQDPFLRKIIQKARNKYKNLVVRL